MNELTVIEGLPGWDALPAEERLKVRKLHAACQQIAAAPNKKAAYKMAAQAMEDAGHPLSWQSVQRKFLAWQMSGSLLALADLRMAGMRPTRARVKHPGFVVYWTELQTRCQRNGGQAYPMLLEIWRKKSEVIPGYEGWPGWPQIPVGWSKKNLMRIKPAALEAKVMREGMRSAAPLLPMVLTTRVGMEVGEYYVSDDNWLDTHVICGKQIVRPLYPLTWPEALRAAKMGAVIECSACNPECGNICAVYDDARHVLVDWIWTDWVLTPDAADIAAPWRVVSPDSEEVQP